MRNKEVEFNDLERGLVIYTAEGMSIKEITIESQRHMPKDESGYYFDYSYRRFRTVDDIEGAPIVASSDFSVLHGKDLEIDFYYFDMIDAAEECKELHRKRLEQMGKFFDDVKEWKQEHGQKLKEEQQERLRLLRLAAKGGY